MIDLEAEGAKSLAEIMAMMRRRMRLAVATGRLGDDLEQRLTPEQAEALSIIEQDHRLLLDREFAETGMAWPPRGSTRFTRTAGRA